MKQQEVKLLERTGEEKRGEEKRGEERRVMHQAESVYEILHSYS